MKIIVVSSFKGGVGKSTITTELAKALVRRKYSVTVLDLDVTTPNMEEIEGVTLEKSMLNVIPSSRDIKRLIRIASKNNSEYLLIDTPPTVSTITLTLVDNIIKPKPQFLYVTTPSKNAIKDTAQGIRFFSVRGGVTLGLIQNMVGDDFGGAIDSDKEFSVPTLSTIELSDKNIDKKFDVLVDVLKYTVSESSATETEQKIMSKVTIQEIKDSYSLKTRNYGIPLKFYNLETWDDVRDLIVEQENLATVMSGTEFMKSRFDITTDEIEKIISYGDYAYCMVREDLAVEGAPPKFAIEEMKIYWEHPKAKGLPMFISKSGANLWVQEVSVLSEKERSEYLKNGEYQEIDTGKYIPTLFHYQCMYRAFTRFTIESECVAYKRYIEYSGIEIDRREFDIGLLVLEGIIDEKQANTLLENDVDLLSIADDFDVGDYLSKYNNVFY